MAGLQLVNGQIVNPLQAKLDAVAAQSQSYQNQLAALQNSISGANVYHPPAYQQAAVTQPTYTPYTPSTARWSPINTMPASSSPSTSMWTPPAGIPTLLAAANAAPPAANAPSSGVSGLAASGGK